MTDIKESAKQYYRISPLCCIIKLKTSHFESGINFSQTTMERAIEDEEYQSTKTLYISYNDRETTLIMSTIH